MTDLSPIRDHLRALPEVELPETLWQRVQAGRKHRVQRRRLITGLASLTLVMVATIATLTPMRERGKTRNDAVAMHTDSVDDKQAELRAIDQALQAAYDRGASDAEIAPMWVVRAAMLTSATARPNKNQT